MSEVFDLKKHPVHLGQGATATVQPEFTGVWDWYLAYGERTAADGVEGRLVSLHTFDAPWDSWEMHPRGEELVVCVSGRLTVIQEADSGIRSVTLEPGQAVVNPPGVWHTADVIQETTALFVTAGFGTQNRPRAPGVR